MPVPPDQVALRRTVIAGQSYDDDYVVIWDELSIGRILKQPGMPKGRPNWSWGVALPNVPQQTWMRGIEVDLEECKRRFKLAWGAVHAKLTDEDIAKAREMQEAGTRHAKRWQDR